MVRITVVVLLFYGLALASGLGLDLDLNQGLKLNVRDYHRLNRLRHLSEEFFSRYRNITLEDLVPETRLPTAQDLQCYAQFAQLTAGLVSGELWAFRSE